MTIVNRLGLCKEDGAEEDLLLLPRSLLFLGEVIPNTGSATSESSLSSPRVAVNPSPTTSVTGTEGEGESDL